MKLTDFPVEYQAALPVIRELELAGHQAYFVGGSVRDCLLDQPIHDVDIATSAFPAEVKAVFSRTIDVGIEHGTVLVLTARGKYEVTTFRTESTYQDYRRPDRVEFVRSLEEDLKRRDFTINAFALQQDGTVIDLFDGLNDLQQKKLRAVGNPYERFSEDALRMMRGLRFVSQLGFTLAENTFKAIKENHSLLAKISVERIYVEFVKLLLGKYRAAGLKDFIATECFMECPGLEDQQQGLAEFIELPGIPIGTEQQAWVLLLDQLTISASQIRPFLKKWKCSNEMIRAVQNLSAGLQERKTTAFTLKQLYRLGKEQALLVEEMLVYYKKTTDYARIDQLDQMLPIHSLRDLAVNGNDLMQYFDQQAGKWLKTTLAYLENAVVEQRVANTKEQLLQLAKEKMTDLFK